MEKSLDWGEWQKGPRGDGVGSRAEAEDTAVVYLCCQLGLKTTGLKMKKKTKNERKSERGEFKNKWV